MTRSVLCQQKTIQPANLFASIWQILTQFKD
jgi:hypothetical protein